MGLRGNVLQHRWCLKTRAPFLIPSGLRHTAPIFSSFAPAPQGLGHSPTIPLGVLAHNRKWILLETKKENSGYQWKEGASIAQKTSGEWMACPGQTLPSLTSGKRGKAQKRGGSSRTLLPQDEAVAPSNLGEGRSLEAEPPGPWDSPTVCVVLDRRLSSSSARV